jgi:hypothetical protein
MSLPTFVGADRRLAAPSSGEAAILRTVLYADVFNYPLTASEIHRYLIGEALSLDAVQAMLSSSPWLADRLMRASGFYMAADRENLAALRKARSAPAARLWQAARRYGRLIAHLPFVRMVAVTGALAMDNVEADGDVDYLIVTAPGRVWLARALTILVVRLARLAGVNLCPNYLLAETSLQLDERDLFVAHELAQMAPLAGHAVYWQMRAVNGWAADYLPNAVSAPVASDCDAKRSNRSNRLEPDAAPRGPGRRWLEWPLAGRLGDALEGWERRRKLEKFQAQLRQPGSAAVLDESHVKGHFDDYGGLTLENYERRCAEYFIL